MGPTGPVMQATRGRILGADSLGNVVYVPQTGTTTSGQDSLEAWMFNRRTMRSVLVGRLMRRRGLQAKDGQGREGALQADRLGGTEERIAIARDGWIAVVRVDPLRLQWRRPDGVWLPDVALPEERIAVTDRERRWYMSLEGASGSEGEWPRYYPEMTGVMASPGGTLAILRHQSERHPFRRYLVVHRAGGALEEWRFANGERLLALGTHRAFAVRTDTASGSERIAAWPLQPRPQ